jgi:hypothetical protein
MLPAPPRPLEWRGGSVAVPVTRAGPREREREFGPVEAEVMLPAPPRPEECFLLSLGGKRDQR